MLQENRKRPIHDEEIEIKCEEVREKPCLKPRAKQKEGLELKQTNKHMKKIKPKRLAKIKIKFKK